MNQSQVQVLHTFNLSTWKYICSIFLVKKTFIQMTLTMNCFQQQHKEGQHTYVNRLLFTNEGIKKNNNSCLTTPSECSNQQSWRQRRSPTRTRRQPRTLSPGWISIKQLSQVSTIGLDGTWTPFLLILFPYKEAYISIFKHIYFKSTYIHQKP